MNIDDKLFGVTLPEPDEVSIPQGFGKVLKEENPNRVTFEKQNILRISFKFSWDIVNGIKELKNRKFDSSTKNWLLTIDFVNVASVVEFFAKHNFYVETKAQSLLELHTKEAEDVGHADIANLQLLQVPETVNATLRPYQIEGFSAMVHWKKAFNGCEMGLGKTLQALVAVEYKKAFPCLVICPASLKYNWRNEINKFLPNRKVQILDAKERVGKGYDFYIINYDNLKKKKEDLERINAMCIIADESHYIKNKKAQRSSVAMDLIKAVPYAYLLSGTPIENRPSELISQIEAIGRLPLFGNYWSFVKRYCGAKRGRFGMDISGATNTEELHFTMAKNFYFRRNKSDVLKDLPSKVYTTIPVEIDNYAEYSYAERQLVNYLKGNVAEKEEIKRATKGMSKEEKAEYIENVKAEQEGKVNRAEHLVLMTTLRKVTAKGKINSAKEWVNDFFENSPNEKILIFAWHTEVVLQLAKEFNCGSIHGGVDVKKRQEIVDAFQNNANEKILVLNIKAGGVGLNLTKASNVLFIEEPYNPALKLQAEDRAHRIGQVNSVNVYTMVGEGTIDESVRELVESKLQVVNAVNAGDFGLLDEEDLDIMKELMLKIKSR